MLENEPNVGIVDDDRGVSSVIGTVLMVGLVVVLAASIALVVIGIVTGRVGDIEGFMPSWAPDLLWFVKLSMG